MAKLIRSDLVAERQPENRRENRRTKKQLHPAMIPYQFKPGQSGNPGGRPRKLTNMLEQLLAMKKPKDRRGRSYAQALVEALVNRAIAKSDVLTKEIFDRIEGRVSRNDEETHGQDGVKVVIVDVPRPDRSVLNVPQPNGKSLLPKGKAQHPDPDTP